MFKKEQLRSGKVLFIRKPIYSLSRSNRSIVRINYIGPAIVGVHWGDFVNLIFPKEVIHYVLILEGHDPRIKPICYNKIKSVFDESYISVSNRQGRSSCDGYMMDRINIRKYFLREII
jgi:hypothetical protein